MAISLNFFFFDFYFAHNNLTYQAKRIQADAILDFSQSVRFDVPLHRLATICGNSSPRSIGVLE